VGQRSARGAARAAEEEASRGVTIKELLAAKKAGRHKRDDVLVDLRLQRPLWVDARADDQGPRRAARATRIGCARALEKFAKSPAAGDPRRRPVVAGSAHASSFTEAARTFASAVDWNQFRKAIGVTLTQLLEDVCIRSGRRS
jgi:hypothetical protein